MSKNKNRNIYILIDLFKDTFIYLFIYWLNYLFISVQAAQVKTTGGKISNFENGRKTSYLYLYAANVILKTISTA